MQRLSLETETLTKFSWVKPKLGNLTQRIKQVNQVKPRITNSKSQPRNRTTLTEDNRE